jgi:hypothetical protein
MSLFKRQKALVIGVGIIVLTNAVALGGVAYNRSGKADSSLQLTERELGYNSYEYDDNSGIAVSLKWQVLSMDDKHSLGFDGASYGWTNYSRDAYWLNDAKLRELGFDTTLPVFLEAGAYRYKQLKEREVYLVLEFNGPAYRRYLDQVKAVAKERKDKAQAMDEIKLAENEASRLFAIDANLDPDVLRKRYPDRKMYIVTKGIVGANWQSTDANPELNAYITNLSVSRLHVPKPHDAVFSNFSDAKGADVGFRIDVDYGKRYEPWITSARKTKP